MQLTPINKHFIACDQKWEHMTEKGIGRLCTECDNVLVDMVGKTEQQVLDLQKQHGNKLCGRYTIQQMHRIDRYVSLQEQQLQRNTTPWLVKLAMGVAVSAIPSLVSAQQPLPSHWVDKPIPIDSLVEIHPGYHSPWVRPQQKVDKIIRGSVRDSITNEPIPFANIFITTINDSTIEVVASDLDGFFTLKVTNEMLNRSDSLILKCSSVGYKIWDLPLNEVQSEHTLDLIQAAERCSIVVVVAGKYVKPTPKQKFINSIKPAHWYRRIKQKIEYKRATR